MFPKKKKRGESICSECRHYCRCKRGNNCLMEWGVFKQTHWRMMQCLSFGHMSAEHLCNWFCDCRTFHLTSVAYYHLEWSPPNGQNKETVFLQDDFCGCVSWVCLLSKLWFAFLTMAITMSPTALQGSLLGHSSIHFTDNIQNFGSCVISIVGHDSSWKTQENTKICTSFPPHLDHGKRLHFFFF